MIELPDNSSNGETSPAPKFPPANKEALLADYTHWHLKEESIKKLIRDCPTEYHVFHQLAAAYNICSRKKRQLTNYGMSNNWI